MSKSLPSIDELNELAGAIHACIKLAEQMDEMKLPDLDELNERIDAMQSCIRLADELPDMQPS